MPRTAVLAKFDALHTSCRKGVRRTTKDKERDLTSLTSKALWCCYPNAVPIYDAGHLMKMTSLVICKPQHAANDCSEVIFCEPLKCCIPLEPRE